MFQKVVKSVSCRSKLKLYRVRIPKQKLNSISEGERILFFQLGNLFNELNILHKCLIVSNPNKKYKNLAEERGQNTQSLFFLRILSGKLYEGNELLKNGFFNKVSKEIYPHLSNEDKENLDKLKKYFEKENIVEKVRNKFAFHYDLDNVKSELQRIPDSEYFELYPLEDRANSLYYMSEEMVIRAILSNITPLKSQEALQEAMDLLFGDVIKVAGWFLNFIDSFMLVIVKKIPEIDLEEMGDIDSPDFEKMYLPYFLKKSK
jgi:hypothetical protein